MSTASGLSLDHEQEGSSRHLWGPSLERGPQLLMVLVTISITFEMYMDTPHSVYTVLSGGADGNGTA